MTTFGQPTLVLALIDALCSSYTRKVFENSCHLTSAEFDEKRPLMKKLEQYYATPEPDTSLGKLHALAKKVIGSKNMIESDPEDDSVEEVGNVSKDTSGSSSKISDDELQDRNIIHEFMPTTNPGSSPEPESDDSGIGHSPSKNMAFSCSQCAHARRMKDSLDCEKCASCKKDKNRNIMPKKQVDLEEMLNKADNVESEKQNGQSDNKLPAIEGTQILPAVEEKKKLIVKLKRVDFKGNKQTEPKKGGN